MKQFLYIKYLTNLFFNKLFMYKKYKLIENIIQKLQKFKKSEKSVKI